jgi:hypothetical protein
LPHEAFSGVLPRHKSLIFLLQFAVFGLGILGILGVGTGEFRRDLSRAAFDIGVLVMLRVMWLAWIKLEVS